MIERFYSKDYNYFAAICDSICLPFWHITADYDTSNAFPFISYLDENGNFKTEIGCRGDSHTNVFDKYHIYIQREKTLCGRIWNFFSANILTIWDDSNPVFLHTPLFSKTINFLESKGFEAYNAKLIFEAENDNVKNWFSDRNDFYIYSIPVNEYISKNMSSFNDIIKEYNIQEKKKELSQKMIKDKWNEWDYNDHDVGYLGYHLMTRQDESKNFLNESSYSNYGNIPNDIKQALISNNTSLGNNPAIPDIFDVPFLLKLAQERYEEIKKSLYDIGTIDDFEDTDINSMLSKLIKKCMELERPYKDQLEKLCVNYVIDTFNIPEDTVQFNVSLVDEINLGPKSITVDPVNNDADFEYDDVNSLENLRDEIYKRKILNALCIGESLILSSNIDSYYEKISKISPELCDLYFKIISLNNYSLYMTDNIGINDKNIMQIGSVTVELGNENEQVRITSQGKIFPVLLSETIHGLMELFISHGLPKNKSLAKTVIGKTDFLKAEPWYMRLGPSLWILFSNSFNDITLQDLPYLLKKVSSLEIDKFNYLMKEIFAKTKKGRIIMSKLCNSAKKEIEYKKFTDKMSKMKLNKSIITDEFINEDEL